MICEWLSTEMIYVHQKSITKMNNKISFGKVQKADFSSFYWINLINEYLWM
jgi:hypothetical protein